MSSVNQLINSVMTNKQILESLKVGEVVTSGQILSSLYRKGLIGGYSEYGYLESEQVKYKDEWNGKVSTEWDYIELFPKGNRKEVCAVDVYESREAMREAVGYGDIEYMGCKFDYKYLSGCFKPYLVLTNKFGDTEKKVNRTMSLYGAII